MADFRTYRDRFLEAEIRQALADTRVVGLFGARQTGKTTLAGHLSRRAASYVTFDDLTVQETAKADPMAFARALPRGSVIDEVQRVPDILPAIKIIVDEDPRPGRFVLTGSANLLTMPRLSESLAGRMQVFTLFPFAQAELERSGRNFVDQIFSGTFDVRHTVVGHTIKEDFLQRIPRGGYPEVIARPQKRRNAWFESYVETILRRDVREIAAIEDALAMHRLLRVAAARSAGMLNETALSSQIGLPRKTLSRYLGILERLYLVWRLPAYARNRAHRAVKSPKLYLNDTGLAAYLLGADAVHLRRDRNLLGGLLETFVAAELRAQASWSRNRPELYHYREHDGLEVDLLLERHDGKVAAVVVKATSSPGATDLSGLQRVAAEMGSALAAGVLLYGGNRALPFGKRLYALPISALWSYLSVA